MCRIIFIAINVPADVINARRAQKFRYIKF